MAELEVSGAMTLVELAKRLNNSQIMDIAEVLDKTNEIFKDMPMVEANQPTSHVIAQRTALPSGSWRQINQGVAYESSLTKQIVEPIGMLESYSKCDEALAMMSGNPARFRWTEDKAFIEGLAQTFATAFFYGDTATVPEKFNGLSVRAAYDAAADTYVIDAGGSGSDCTSIWVCEVGEDKVHLIYPRGSRSMGISAEDMGIQLVLESTSSLNVFRAYVTHFVLRIGLAIHDDKAVQRIASIESAGSSNIFDPDNLVKAINLLPSMGKNAVIYCNKTIRSQMDINVMDKTNVYYTIREPYGEPLLYFRGVPVRTCEAITDTETAL